MDDSRNKVSKETVSNMLKARKQGNHGRQVFLCIYIYCVHERISNNLLTHWQDPHKARTAQTQKWSNNCLGGQVVCACTNRLYLLHAQDYCAMNCVCILTKGI